MVFLGTGTTGWERISYWRLLFFSTSKQKLLTNVKASQRILLRFRLQQVFNIDRSSLIHLIMAELYWTELITVFFCYCFLFTRFSNVPAWRCPTLDPKHLCLAPPLSSLFLYRGQLFQRDLFLEPPLSSPWLPRPSRPSLPAWPRPWSPRPPSLAWQSSLLAAESWRRCGPSCPLRRSWNKER